MAQSPPYSPSPSPGIPSTHEISSSSSSDDDFVYNGPGEVEPGSASRGGSPVPLEQPATGEDEGEDTIACQWEDCGRVFNHLPSLIDHIHNGMQQLQLSMNQKD